MSDVDTEEKREPDEERSMRKRVIALEGLMAMLLGDGMAAKLKNAPRDMLSQKSKELRTALRAASGKEKTPGEGKAKARKAAKKTAA
jgi:hypothetical protein